MTGFCSCKTGIHAIPGNNLGKTVKTSIWYCYRLRAPTFGKTCSECGGAVKIIAGIEAPAVIQKVLAHLDDRASPADLSLLAECRAPPATGLFD